MVEEVINAMIETLAAPGYQKILARLVGSVPDHPQLTSTYWCTYLVRPREAAARILEDARIAGLIPDKADPGILLDLIGGAVMHHILVRQGGRSKGELHAYLIKIFRELGLMNVKERQRRTE